MSEPIESNELQPVAAYLKIPKDGRAPYLEGYVCNACGATFLEAYEACARCAGRDSLRPKLLANEGSLYTYSIVHRSFPGVAVPFVSVVVDLDGGGTVKGNLIGVEPDPSQLSPGMRVSVVFGDALGRKDRAGHAYLSYFFRPLV